jgi:hypothetical protein
VPAHMSKPTTVMSNHGTPRAYATPQAASVWRSTATVPSPGSGSFGSPPPASCPLRPQQPAQPGSNLYRRRS